MVLPNLCNRQSLRAPIVRSTTGRTALAVPSGETHRRIDRFLQRWVGFSGAQLRLVWRLTAPSSFGRFADTDESAGTAGWRRHPAAAFSTACRAREHGPLTPPVATWSPGDESRRLPATKDRLSAALVNEHGLGRPGTPSIDRCLPAPCDACRPATGPAVLPLRSGFRRSFAPRLLCTGGARPARPSRTLFALGERRAARRLSTSAIDAYYEHDRERSELRRTSPMEAHRSSPSSVALAFQPTLRTADGDAPFGAQPAEMSRVRDLETRRLPCSRRSPPRSLAGATLPQPVRPGHPLSLRVLERGLENPAPIANPRKDGCRSRAARSAASSGP